MMIDMQILLGGLFRPIHQTGSLPGQLRTASGSLFSEPNIISSRIQQSSLCLIINSNDIMLE